MKYTSVGTGKFKRLLTRREPVHEPGVGWKYVNDGYETSDLEVLVDVDMLISILGPKAMKSQSGRSKLQGGAVLVRVLSRQKSES